MASKPKRNYYRSQRFRARAFLLLLRPCWRFDCLGWGPAGGRSCARYGRSEPCRRCCSRFGVGPQPLCSGTGRRRSPLTRMRARRPPSRRSASFIASAHEGCRSMRRCGRRSARCRFRCARLAASPSAAELKRYSSTLQRHILAGCCERLPLHRSLRFAGAGRGVEGL